MKYLNLTKNIAVIAVVSLLFMACKKAKVATPMGDAGQTLVKILAGGTPPAIFSKPIDFLPTPTKIVAVEIRRDVPSNTELNKVMVVTVKDDTAAVSFFNQDTVSSNPNRTNPGKLFYIHLPPTWYNPEITGGVKAGGQGGVYTLTFQPGEFSKTIFVVVPDATVFNPSAKYALGFTVLSADQGAVLSTQRAALVEIGAKNAYDGIYSYESGFVQRYSGPGPTNPICCDGLTGPYGAANPDIFMSTTGAYTVAIPGAGSAGQMTWSGGTSGIAGIDGVRITVDPVTNNTTVMSLGNATLANRPGGINRYDPATKSFHQDWRWNPTATTRDLQVVWKYKGPR